MPPSAAIQRCEGVLIQPAPLPCQTTKATRVVVPPTDMRSMYPLAGVTAVRRDETGTWWAEVHGVPQPRQHLHQTWFVVPKQFDPPVVNQAGAVVVSSCCNTAPACSAKPGELCGTWVREMDGIVVAVTFTGKEMKLCATRSEDGSLITVVAVAEYTLTKDGLVYGVVSGVDVTAKRCSGEKVLPEIDLPLSYIAMLDTPFSFRVKPSSVGMMVSNVKVASSEGIRGQEFVGLCGMYKPCKEGCIPAPQSEKEAKSFQGLTLPSGRYLEKHYPEYFAPDADVPLPRIVASTEEPPLAPKPREVVVITPTVVASTPVLTPPVVRPTQPANIPTAEFEAMAGTFGKMLAENQPGTATSPTPIAVPLPMPGATVQQTGYSVPLNAPALGQPCPLPAAVRPSITGTWTREIGPIVYVVKIAPDHVTITASSSVELPDGKSYCEGIVMTADYHLSRDGTTIVGLITSVDAVIEGTLPPEVEMPGAGEDLARIQKLLVDKPMAMSLRVYGDVLTIGNVRLPDLESTRGACYPLTVLGGRYNQLGENKPLPKPKAVKVTLPRDLVPLPLETVPIPAYIPPTPPAVRPAGGVPPAGYGYSSPPSYFFPPTPIPLPPLPQNVPNTLPPVPDSVPVEMMTLPQVEGPTIVPASEPTEPQPKPGKKGKKKSK
jgi:hypothetical protein